MSKIDDVFRILQTLRKENGRIISLSSVYRTVFREGISNSYSAIASCLKRLEAVGKIRLINFGNNIELIDKEEDVSEELSKKTGYVQSSLINLRKK